jgi:stage V sporulation protein G
MNVSEIRIKLVDEPGDKLRAFASLTIDACLVVRDVKVIEGPKGLFVAMPSRKLMERCPQCAYKNPLRSRYCNDCGARLSERRSSEDRRGERLYADIAHPIHQEARDLLERLVLEAYRRELEQAALDGYQSRGFEDLDYQAYDRA